MYPVYRFLHRSTVLNIQIYQYSFQISYTSSFRIPVYEKCMLPNYQRYRFQILIAKIEDLNENCVYISCSYLSCFLRNKPSKSVTVGTGRFIILNYLASLKIVIKIGLNFSHFFKGLRAVRILTRNESIATIRTKRAVRCSFAEKQPTCKAEKKTLL